jgi:Na+/proline symporter
MYSWIVVITGIVAIVLVVVAEYYSYKGDNDKAKLLLYIGLGFLGVFMVTFIKWIWMKYFSNAPDPNNQYGGMDHNYKYRNEDVLRRLLYNKNKI